MLYVELDVNYSDDPKVIDAGEKAELLYVRSLCYVKRLLTDGYVADSQLARFLLPGVAARASRLVEVGLWQRDPTRPGYVITSWLKRNKSAAEVHAITEAKSQGGQAGNHRRWHTNRIVDGCPLCDASRSTDRTSDRGSESTETETETETDVATDKRPPRATPPPDIFPVTASMQAWSTAHGITINITAETDRFLDFHRAKGSKFKDWPAAWRNWMAKAQQYAERDGLAGTDGPRETAASDRW